MIEYLAYILQVWTLSTEIIAQDEIRTGLDESRTSIGIRIDNSSSNHPEDFQVSKIRKSDIKIRKSTFRNRTESLDSITRGHRI